jgi:AraC-like DNA-binding protein
MNYLEEKVGHVSARTRASVASDCWNRYQRAVYWLKEHGELAEPVREGSPLGLPQLQHAVTDALEEAHRWGDTYSFFLCPSVLAWVVPLCNGDEQLGGLLSGEVLLDEGDRAEAEYYLRGCGFPAQAASEWAARLPVWPEGRSQEAATQLFQDFYRRSGWIPSTLIRKREDAAQQRQIAEAIHSRKSTMRIGYPLDDERRLLAMIRVGDNRGARTAMNQLLAGLFMHAPALPVLRARAVELLGYLVRAAVEDNHMLEPLIEQNQSWIERLVTAPDFDAICAKLRDALDAFIASVAAQGFNRANPSVHKALDYISHHYTQALTLADVAEAAGLSTYRIAHLVKAATGRSVMEHVRVLRVTRTRELLEKSALKGSEIAMQLGYHDQSHLIREFRSVTGTTPEQYRRRMHGEAGYVDADVTGEHGPADPAALTRTRRLP